ncbi:MAG: CHRD domain-containing protein [Cyclobacteriaceae bacterium]
MKKSLQLIPKMVWKGSVITICYLLFAACMQHDESLAPRNSDIGLLSDELSAQASEQSLMAKRTFTAHLSGGNEVPANAMPGQGQVIFHLSEDGTEMSYKLIVANIENVRAAHIHCAAAGVNGPVVVPLFGTPTTGVSNGVLAEGTITDANVNALACIGSVKSLEAVVDLIRSGNAYVNVHTTQLPGGEIRGQIK